MTDTGTPSDDALVEDTTEPTASGMVRSSLWVAAGTALSRLTGFARVFVLAYAVGQSELANLYTVANAAPNLVFELVVGGVLSATLVPAFVRAREGRNDEASSVLLSVGFVASLVLTLVAMAGTLVYHHTIADTGRPRDVVIVTFLYLLLPQILFYGATSLGTAFLNAARQYRTAAFAPVLTNVVSIAAFVVVGARLQGRDAVLEVGRSNTTILLWLGLGTTAGIVAMTIPVMWAVGHGDTDLRFLPWFRHESIRRVRSLAGWTFGYVAANQVALAVVIIALEDNKRYSDAFVFFQLPHGLIAVSIMTTMTPELASAATRGDMQLLARRFERGLRMLATLIVPAAVGYVLLATPITSFLQRGNLTVRDAQLTAQTLVAFAIGLPAFSAYLYAQRGFYALSDTRTPFFLNLMENALNVAGVLGLVALGSRSSTTFAAAYSVAYVVAAAAALRRLGERLRALDPAVPRRDVAPYLRIGAAALALAAVVLVVRLALPADAGGGAIVSVVVATAAGMATYVAVGTTAGVEELSGAWAMVRRRVGR